MQQQKMAAPHAQNAAHTKEMIVYASEYNKILPYLEARVNSSSRPAVVANRPTREEREAHFLRDVQVGMVGELSLYKLALGVGGVDLYIMQRAAMAIRPVYVGDSGTDLFNIDLKTSRLSDRLHPLQHHLIVPLACARRPEHSLKAYALCLVGRLDNGDWRTLHCGWISGSELEPVPHQKFQHACAVKAYQLTPWIFQAEARE